MSSDGDIESLIRRIVKESLQWQHAERHGMVTSYDPKKYLGKVLLMPEGQETGWLPIETGHIGESYGITIGLQPGQGGHFPQGQGTGKGAAQTQASPNQGDQVIVRFQEGDLESGKIVQRVHSAQDHPPPAQSGEMILWTKFQKSGGPTPDAASGGQGGTGQQIYFKNDGSISWTDGNGATIVCDGNGNIKITGKVVQIDAQTFTVVASGDAGIQGGGNVVVNAGGKTGINAGGPVVVKAGGSVSDGAVTPPNDAPATDPFKVP